MRNNKQSVNWNGSLYHLQDYDEEMGNILILKSWKQQWYDYMCDVLNFFLLERADLADNLLIFDIEHDGAQKIVDFAARFGMQLKAKHFSHEGRTMKSPIPRLALQIQLQKWENITMREPMFVEEDGFDTETERILAHCREQGQE